jgi:hypothetical protein
LIRRAPAPYSRAATGEKSMTNEVAAAAGAYTLRPIGAVRGGRAEPIDDGWDAVTATIALTPRCSRVALGRITPLESPMARTLRVEALFGMATSDALQSTL